MLPGSALSWPERSTTFGIRGADERVDKSRQQQRGDILRGQVVPRVGPPPATGLFLRAWQTTMRFLSEEGKGVRPAALREKSERPSVSAAFRFPHPRIAGNAPRFPDASFYGTSLRKGFQRRTSTHGLSGGRICPCSERQCLHGRAAHRVRRRQVQPFFPIRQTTPRARAGPHGPAARAAALL